MDKFQNIQRRLHSFSGFRMGFLSAIPALFAGATAINTVLPYGEVYESHKKVNEVELLSCLKAPGLDLFEPGELHQYSTEGYLIYDIKTRNHHSMIFQSKTTGGVHCRHTIHTETNGEFRVYQNNFSSNLLQDLYTGCETKITTVGEFLDYFFPMIHREAAAGLFGKADPKVESSSLLAATYCPYSQKDTVVLNLGSNENLFLRWSDAPITSPYANHQQTVQFFGSEPAPDFYAKSWVGLPQTELRSLPSHAFGLGTIEAFWGLPQAEKEHNGLHKVLAETDGHATYKGWKAPPQTFQQGTDGKTNNNSNNVFSSTNMAGEVSKVHAAFKARNPGMYEEMLSTFPVLPPNAVDHLDFFHSEVYLFPRRWEDVLGGKGFGTPETFDAFKSDTTYNVFYNAGTGLYNDEEVRPTDARVVSFKPLLHDGDGKLKQHAELTVRLSSPDMWTPWLPSQHGRGRATIVITEQFDRLNPNANGKNFAVVKATFEQQLENGEFAPPVERWTKEYPTVEGDWLFADPYNFSTLTVSAQRQLPLNAASGSLIVPVKSQKEAFEEYNRMGHLLFDTLNDLKKGTVCSDAFDGMLKTLQDQLEETEGLQAVPENGFDTFARIEMLLTLIESIATNVNSATPINQWTGFVVNDMELMNNLNVRAFPHLASIALAVNEVSLTGKLVEDVLNDPAHICNPRSSAHKDLLMNTANTVRDRTAAFQKVYETTLRRLIKVMTQVAVDNVDQLKAHQEFFTNVRSQLAPLINTKEPCTVDCELKMANLVEYLIDNDFNAKAEAMSGALSQHHWTIGPTYRKWELGLSGMVAALPASVADKSDLQNKIKTSFAKLETYVSESPWMTDLTYDVIHPLRYLHTNGEFPSNVPYSPATAKQAVDKMQAVVNKWKTTALAAAEEKHLLPNREKNKWADNDSISKYKSLSDYYKDVVVSGAEPTLTEDQKTLAAAAIDALTGAASMELGKQLLQHDVNMMAGVLNALQTRYDPSLDPNQDGFSDAAAAKRDALYTPVLTATASVLTDATKGLSRFLSQVDFGTLTNVSPRFAVTLSSPDDKMTMSSAFSPTPELTYVRHIDAFSVYRGMTTLAPNPSRALDASCNTNTLRTTHAVFSDTTPAALMVDEGTGAAPLQTLAWLLDPRLTPTPTTQHSHTRDTALVATLVAPDASVSPMAPFYKYMQQYRVPLLNAFNRVTEGSKAFKSLHQRGLERTNLVDKAIGKIETALHHAQFALYKVEELINQHYPTSLHHNEQLVSRFASKQNLDVKRLEVRAALVLRLVDTFLASPKGAAAISSWLTELDFKTTTDDDSSDQLVAAYKAQARPHSIKAVPLIKAYRKFLLDEQTRWGQAGGSKAGAAAGVTATIEEHVGVCTSTAKLAYGGVEVEYCQGGYSEPTKYKVDMSIVYEDADWLTDSFVHENMHWDDLLVVHDPDSDTTLTVILVVLACALAAAAAGYWFKLRPASKKDKFPLLPE